MEPQSALQQACVVGALATTRMGAQSSPALAEVNTLLQEQPD
jgi:sugar/nucleoside kinase (ribokinase family)